MKQFTKIALTTGISIVTGMSASAGTLNGTKWQSVDDKTGAKKAVIEFSDKGGIVSGKIIKINDAAKKNSLCKRCKGNLKNKKIEGLRIIWGLKSTGKNKWGNGQLVDPESGKVYKGKITLTGNKIKLRGYVGVAALGRSQTWTKIN